MWNCERNMHWCIQTKYTFERFHAWHSNPSQLPWRLMTWVGVWKIFSDCGMNCHIWKKKSVTIGKQNKGNNKNNKLKWIHFRWLYEIEWTMLLMQNEILITADDSSMIDIGFCTMLYLCSHSVFLIWLFNGLLQSQSVMKLFLNHLLLATMMQCAKKCQKPHWRHITNILRHLSAIGDIQHHILAPPLGTEWTGHHQFNNYSELS